MRCIITNLDGSRWIGLIDGIRNFRSTCSRRILYERYSFSKLSPGTYVFRLRSQPGTLPITPEESLVCLFRQIRSSLLHHPSLPYSDVYIPRSLRVHVLVRFCRRKCLNKYLSFTLACVTFAQVHRNVYRVQIICPRVHGR